MTGRMAGALDTLVSRFDPEPFDDGGRKVVVRLVVRGGEPVDVEIDAGKTRVREARNGPPDAELTADAATWKAIAGDTVEAMSAYRAGRLSVRRNLHLGVGFLAATSANREPGRLRFHTVPTRHGRMSVLEAGTGEPLVLLHGLGATKAEFLPTVAALAPAGYRTIAVDLPGFGDSDKPFPAPYDARFFARWVVALLDSLSLDRAHVLGHSMGGRVAIEVGLRHPERLRSLIMMTPSLAWRGHKRFAGYLRVVRPELGYLQITPRPIVEAIVRRLVIGGESDWVGAGIDEFLRAYLTPRGRVAFYAAARQIYLEDGDGPNGFWHRLERLSPYSMFIWGRRDQLVPIGFERHVRQAVPSAHHVEIDTGHVPQFERPGRLHREITHFLEAAPAAAVSRQRRSSRAGVRRAATA